MKFFLKTPANVVKDKSLLVDNDTFKGSQSTD